MHNVKSKALKHILVFIPQEDPTKQAKLEIRLALGHLSASLGGVSRLAAS